MSVLSREKKGKKKMIDSEEDSNSYQPRGLKQKKKGYVFGISYIIFVYYTFTYYILCPVVQYYLLIFHFYTNNFLYIFHAFSVVLRKIKAQYSNTTACEMLLKCFSNIMGLTALMKVIK